MAAGPTPTPSTVVTGALGFAGSHLVDRLNGRGGSIPWDLPSVDILDRGQVRRALAQVRPSRIYHLAGAARVDASWANVVPHLRTNVLGTHHILDAVRELRLPCRIVVVTSGMIYTPSDGPLTEESPIGPASPYAVSKVAQDDLSRVASEADGLDVVIARPFNHIGPRQTPHFVVASFARQIAMIEAGRCEPVLQVGNLSAARDLTDVRDVAAAYEAIMDRGVSGRAYNISSGRSVFVRDVLDQLLQLSTRRVDVQVDERKLRPSDTPIVLGDSTRLQQDVGWAPQFPLTRTLADTLDWWREQVRNSTFV